MDTQHDPATDPRANDPIPSVYVPGAIADARQAIAEVVVLAGMIEREGNTETAAAARRLKHAAIHFGQAVNLLSAVAIPPPCAPLVPVDVAPLPWRARWGAAWRVLLNG